jgi:phospholipid/cholesterol/gamma-HCH transport system permease protein
MEATKKSQTESAAIRLERPDEDTLLVVLSGQWKLGYDLPAAEEIQRQIESDPDVQRITFDADDLSGWDSGLLTFLIKIKNACTGRKINLDSDGLPEGVKRLLALASAVPEKKDTGRANVGEPVLSRIGSQVIEALRSGGEIIAFIGEATLAFTKLLGGKARFRRSDLVLVIQECGADALPIVTLISVLIGLILAFMGAVQLKLFGAEIYIASLVAIGMTREMGAMMAAIIMAGRTGAAFAAQLGTMPVN